MIIGNKPCTLAKDYEPELRQGDKIEFKWHGSDMLYIGRIEVDEFDEKYFVNEFNYNTDQADMMKWYNKFDSFYCLTYFNKIE